LAIRLLAGPVPGVAMLAGAGALLFYPKTK
jgi:hypothetical protein